MLKRVKRRYLALDVDSTETFDSKKLMDTFWAAITKLYGEYGASRSGLTFIDYNSERRFIIIRVANAAIDMVRASLASITKIDNKPVAVHILAISGTIKALHRNITNRSS